MEFVYTSKMTLWRRIKIFLLGGKAAVTLSKGWEPLFAKEFDVDTDEIEWMNIIFERFQWPPKGPKFLWRVSK